MRAARLSKAKAPLAIDAVNEQENFVIVLARQNTSAPTVGVECLDGFKFPALVVAVLFSRRLWKMMTLTTPSTNWAPGVCFGAARAFGYKLAQDVLSILLGLRRRCYGHRR